MSNKGVRNLFIFGSLFFFVVFVAMTVDTMKRLDKRAPEITEDINQGKKLWHKYDCIGCHTILGNGSYFAPDLTKTLDDERGKSASYIKKFLMNPKKVKKDASMPALGITEEEADKIIAFLDWVSKVDTNGWPPKPVLARYGVSMAPGGAMYENNGCSACHMINGVGGTSGPDLTNVASRVPDREWHIQHLKDPGSLVPDSAMPPYAHISEEELNQLVDYILSLK